MGDNDIIYTVIFSTLIILLLIAGVAITIFIANRQRAQMQLDYQKELRTVQQEVQEQVLLNVSRELHDNVGMLLSTVNFLIEQKKVVHPEIGDALHPIQESLLGAIDQVKLLGRSLGGSDILDQQGLLNTIQMEINRLKQINRFTFHWASDNKEPALNKDQKLMSYRIFQELLNNAMKHAAAKNIHVTLTGQGAFKLIIEDDGRGFNADEKIQEGKGSGLKNIVKRAALANLKCDIAAETGKGSIFTLSEMIASKL